MIVIKIKIICEHFNDKSRLKSVRLDRYLNRNFFLLSPKLRKGLVLFSFAPFFNIPCWACLKNMKPVTVLFFVFCLIDFGLIKKVPKKNEKKQNFLFGRIPPGYFEYPDLNGFYSPKAAAKVCESDTACGGFTFKGVINSPKKVFEVYFFHYVPKEIFDINNGQAQFFHWTSYIAKTRNFTELKNFKIRARQSEELGLCLKDRCD